MSTESSRDDFIIAIRSAFLKKGNRQKFSLFTLLIISILVLSLEYFKTGPVNQFRSITKDIIFRGSYIVSSPFKYVKDKYYPDSYTIGYFLFPSSIIVFMLGVIFSTRRIDGTQNS